MKILVCGGRSYNDYDRVKAVLDGFHQVAKITSLVHGAATGADSLGARWALQNGVLSLPYPAKWSDVSNPHAIIKFTKFGHPYNAIAGILRNQEMLEQNLDLAFVVAFPGNKGTKDMLQRAKKAGVLVHEISP